MPDTTYIVLRRYDARDVERQPSGSVLWQEVAEVAARSAPDAVRHACADLIAGTNAYVAVPARSWKPVQVRAEQQVILKLEQPT